MTYINRNDFSSTYLNICAILSLMGSHDKALHMSQKAVEMITQQSGNKYFQLEEFIEKFIEFEEGKTLLVTLAASYFNKTVELEFLFNANYNKEYLKIALDSINSAAIICQSFPKGTKLSLFIEIAKMHEKMKISKNTVFSGSSRGSSRRTQRRIYSPNTNIKVKDTNMSDLKKYFESSPKSYDGGSAVGSSSGYWSPKDNNPFSQTQNGFTTKIEKPIAPIYKRKHEAVGTNVNKTDLQMYNSAVDAGGKLLLFIIIMPKF